MQEMQVRDIHHMISLICEILKKKSGLLNTENRLVVARGGGGVGR